MSVFTEKCSYGKWKVNKLQTEASECSWLNFVKRQLSAFTFAHFKLMKHLSPADVSVCCAFYCRFISELLLLKSPMACCVKLHHFSLKPFLTRPNQRADACHFFIDLDYFVYLLKLSPFSYKEGKRLICAMMLVLVKLGFGPVFVQDIYKVDI